MAAAKGQAKAKAKAEPKARALTGAFKSMSQQEAAQLLTTDKDTDNEVGLVSPFQSSVLLEAASNANSLCTKVWADLLPVLEGSALGLANLKPAGINKTEKGWCHPWTPATAHCALSTAQKHICSCNLLWFDIVSQFGSIATMLSFGDLMRAQHLCWPSPRDGPYLHAITDADLTLVKADYPARKSLTSMGVSEIFGSLGLALRQAYDKEKVAGLKKWLPYLSSMVCTTIVGKQADDAAALELSQSALMRGLADACTFTQISLALKLNYFVLQGEQEKQPTTGEAIVAWFSAKDWMGGPNPFSCPRKVNALKQIHVQFCCSKECRDELVLIQNSVGREFLADKIWNLYCWVHAMLLGLRGHPLYFAELAGVFEKGTHPITKGCTINALLGRKDRGDLGLLHLWKLKRHLASYIRDKYSVPEAVLGKAGTPFAHDKHSPSTRERSVTSQVLDGADSTWQHNTKKKVDASAIVFFQELFGGELDNNLNVAFKHKKEVEPTAIDEFFTFGDAMPNWKSELELGLKQDQQEGNDSVPAVVEIKGNDSAPARAAPSADVQLRMADGDSDEARLQAIASELFSKYVSLKELPIIQTQHELEANVAAWPMAAFASAYGTSHVATACDVLQRYEVSSEPWKKQTMRKANKHDLAMVSGMVNVPTDRKFALIFCGFHSSNAASLHMQIGKISKEDAEDALKIKRLYFIYEERCLGHISRERGVGAATNVEVALVATRTYELYNLKKERRKRGGGTSSSAAYIGCRSPKVRHEVQLTPADKQAMYGSNQIGVSTMQENVPGRSRKMGRAKGFLPPSWRCVDIDMCAELFSNLKLDAVIGLGGGNFALARAALRKHLPLPTTVAVNNKVHAQLAQKLLMGEIKAFMASEGHPFFPKDLGAAAKALFSSFCPVQDEGD